MFYICIETKAIAFDYYLVYTICMHRKSIYWRFLLYVIYLYLTKENGEL
jgi:hypothetical protein